MPIDVTLSEIVMNVKDEQFWKALPPIDVPLVITTFFSLLFLMYKHAIAGIVASSIGQPLNALLSIDVTLSGIVIEVRDEQLRNALLPIDVTLFGIVIEFRDEQPINAAYPIDVTPFPMVIEDNDVQSLNAYSPIEVTLSGIVMDVKDEQFWNALLPIDVTLFGMIVFLQPKIRVLVLVSMVELQLFLES